MESLKEFIVNNWQYISAALVVVLEIILMLIKKNPKVIDPSIYSKITSLIQDAEKTFGSGHGEEKKQFVVSSFLASSPIDTYPKKFVEFVVEDILSTPEKKEVKSDGKK